MKRSRELITIAAAALLVAAAFAPWTSFVGPSGPGPVGAVGVVFTASPKDLSGFMPWSATGPSGPVRSLLLLMAALVIVLFVLQRPAFRRAAAVASVALSGIVVVLLLWGRPPLGIQVYGFHFEPTVGLYAAALGGAGLLFLAFAAILGRP